MAIYHIISHSGAGKYLNVETTTTISGRTNVNLWSNTGSNDQKWSISSLGNNQQVKTLNNLNYMLNANTSTWNCDVYTSNSDTYMNFISLNANTDFYRIQLNSNPSKYLTVDSAATDANVYWSSLDETNAGQKWKISAVSTDSTDNSGTSAILEMPTGPRCNWNQKHSSVTQYFGTSACTLVAGLDAANFFATDGIGYEPVDMNSTNYWIPGTGYTWAIPGPGKIAGKVEFSASEQASALAYIKNQIDEGHPVLISIGYSASSNHTVFGYGYKNGASEYSDIYVYDPYNPDTSSLSGQTHSLYEAMDDSHDYFNIRNVRYAYRS